MHSIDVSTAALSCTERSAHTRAGIKRAGNASQEEGMLFYRLDCTIVNCASNTQTNGPMSEKIQTPVAKE
jgi:hypothetical protein